MTSRQAGPSVPGLAAAGHADARWRRTAGPGAGSDGQPPALLTGGGRPSAKAETILAKVRQFLADQAAEKGASWGRP